MRTQRRATNKARAKPTGDPRPQRDAPQGERLAASHGAPWEGARTRHATDHCSGWPPAGRRRSTASHSDSTLGRGSRPHEPARPQRVDGSPQAGAPDPGPSPPTELQSHAARVPSRGRVACAGKERTELRLLTLTIPQGPKGQVSAAEVTLSPRSKGITSGSQSPRGKGTKS